MDALEGETIGAGALECGDIKEDAVHSNQKGLPSVKCTNGLWAYDRRIRWQKSRRALGEYLSKYNAN